MQLNLKIESVKIAEIEISANPLKLHNKIRIFENWHNIKTRGYSKILSVPSYLISEQFQILIMMERSNSFTFCKVVVVGILTLVNLAQESESFTQELYLHETYDQSGNYLYFRSNVPDASIYNLENVKVVCAKGWWRAYDDFGYLSRSPVAYGDMTSSGVVCQNGTFNHKSFRHFASSNTTENSLSLYVGANYEDREVFITETEVLYVAPPPLMYSMDFSILVNSTTDLGFENGTLYDEESHEESTLMQALVITGNSSWTLYEGQNFTGVKACRLGVTEGYFTYSQLKTLKLRTVQSVKQGCDDHEEDDDDNHIDEHEQDEDNVTEDAEDETTENPKELDETSEEPKDHDESTEEPKELDEPTGKSKEQDETTVEPKENNDAETTEDLDDEMMCTQGTMETL